VRELRLVKKLNEKSRFVRARDSPRMPEDESFTVLEDEQNSFDSTPDITLDGSDPLSDMFPSASEEFAALQASRPLLGERRLSIKDIGNDRVLSESASYGEFIDGDMSGEVIVPDIPGEISPEVEEIVAMLGGGDDLLSSPIELDEAELNAQRQTLVEMDKRGSGLVMSDELDNLERRES